VVSIRKNRSSTSLNAFFNSLLKKMSGHSTDRLSFPWMEKRDFNNPDTTPHNQALDLGCWVGANCPLYKFIIRGCQYPCRKYRDLIVDLLMEGLE